ncbi:RNA pyrophosphohydrolase [Erythrobacter donghaensis]|uniref:RNA pyrophosphohydrolase n=1 Tax=Erythrobacter donghaensis TaxID=267135 RepID=UPI000A39495A|nr:RNA pyrophosphohydrolase [Erythrobacter donghaensis]
MSFDHLPYRPCAGFMLVNRAGLVFVGERIDPSAHGYWQMPQGGIDKGEDVRAAALRELEEEIGVGPDKVEVIAPASRPIRYDLPPELVGKVWKGKYRGQEQHWFLGRFLGEDTDIDLEAHDPPEFHAWRWIAPEDLPALIIPFKRAVYEEVLAEFRSLI